MTSTDFIIDPSWTFGEAVERISARYEPGGYTAGPQRNSLIEAWATLVGRDRAVRELEATVRGFRSESAACRALRISKPILQRFRRSFASVPAIGAGDGLAIYFAVGVKPFERFLVEAIVFAVLGRETTCRLAELREVERGVVMRFTGAGADELQRVGDALWSAFWRAEDARVSEHSMQTILNAGLIPRLDGLRDKLQAIELRLPGPDAVEMLNDKGSDHVTAKDQGLIKTWGQRVVPAAAKRAVQLTLGGVADELAQTGVEAAITKK